MTGAVKTTEERCRRERATKRQRLLKRNPDYKFKVVNYPAAWDESFLTERWEDRKERLAKERENRCD